jgi:hypothetical protein
MNASQLKALIESSRDDSHFFSKENMRFSGDSMGNFGVAGPIPMTNPMDSKAPVILAWELYRRRANRKGLTGSTFWSVESTRQLHGYQSLLNDEVYHAKKPFEIKVFKHMDGRYTAQIAGGWHLDVSNLTLGVLIGDTYARHFDTLNTRF